jgi:hypothetical protein
MSKIKTFPKYSLNLPSLNFLFKIELDFKNFNISENNNIMLPWYNTTEFGLGVGGRWNISILDFIFAPKKGGGGGCSN